MHDRKKAEKMCVFRGYLVITFQTNNKSSNGGNECCEPTDIERFWDVDRTFHDSESA